MRWQAQQQTTIQSTADRPVPVVGLQPTRQGRHWLLDPSFIVPVDVRSANGQLLIAAGSRFNPLHKVHLTQALIFFNGDDREQVDWAKNLNQRLMGKDLLILVKGSLQTMSSQFPKKHIYFDQGGRLVQRLQITHTPAMVQQAGGQLEISEVKP